MGGGFEGVGGEVAGEELGPGGGGDHGGVVGGERDGGEGDGEICVGCCAGEGLAEVGVGGYSAADEDAARGVVLGGAEGGAGEVLDDRVLEAGDEVEGLCVEVREGAGDVGGVGLGFVQAHLAEGLLAGGDGGRAFGGVRRSGGRRS